MNEKGVRVDGLDAETVEDLRREIFEIEGHDAIDMACERGGEDMDVVLVRQSDARQPVPPSTLRYLPIDHGLSHAVPPHLQPTDQVRALPFKRRDPLFLDPGRPFRRG